MVRKTASAGVLLACLLTTAPALAQDITPWTSDRPDGHAPAGVLVDFLLPKGGTYFSVRLYQEQFRGTRVGTQPFFFDDVLDFFSVAPLSLDKEIAEVEFRWGVANWLTLAWSMPGARAEMFSATDAVFFETTSETIGDIKIRGLVDLLAMDDYRMSLTLGGTIPTGQTSRSGATPFTPSGTLPFAMQGGSGTYDLLAGMTFLTQNDLASLGAQFNSVIRMFTNSRGYRLGDEFEFSVWGGYQLNDWVSLSMRGLYQTWGDVTGSDPGTDGTIDPGANSFAQGGERIFLPFGINLMFREGPIAGNRLSLEWYYPIHQELHGPQLSAHRTLVMSWQYHF